MLKLMRDNFKQLKWILVAIVAIFILFIFVEWGAGGSARARDAQAPFAAHVNGETVAMRDYQRALYFTEQQYQQMYGGRITPEMMEQMGIGRQVLDSLVDQRLLLQEAARLHLNATPEEVRKRILAIPILNPNGKFVGQELYARYITTSLGYESPAAFEDDLARQITMDKMESALSNSIVVSPKAAETEYKRLSENAKIKYVLYPASREAATVTPSEPEVDAYYKQNQAKYAHAEQRDLKYLVADQARIRSQINPTDAELHKRYEEQKATFKQPEAAHILHILIKVDRNAPPADDAAAKAKAESLVAQLRAGADFAKLAKENSGDPSSSSKGGDMGFVDKGITVEVFDTAAFSIPLNRISDPIRSAEFGYHIIKVLERRPEGVKPFEEVRGEIRSQMADQTAKDQAREEITRVAALIKQKKPKSADEFAAFANDKISSNATKWFAKSESIPGLGFNEVLTAWTFQAKPGDIGEVVGTQRGPVIPYLAEIRPAGIAPLAEIKAKVEADARAEKAAKLASNALLTAMAGAPTIDAIAQKTGLTAQSTTISRQGFVQGLSGNTQDLIEAAMAAQPGQIKGPMLTTNGAVAFQVLEQKKFDPVEFAKSRGQYVETLRQNEARSLRQSLLKRLRKQSKIDVNEKLLQQAKAGPQEGA